MLEKDFMVAIERFSIDSNDMGSLSQVMHHSLHSNDSHGRLTEVVRDHCGWRNGSSKWIEPYHHVNTYVVLNSHIFPPNENTKQPTYKPVLTQTTHIPLHHLLPQWFKKIKLLLFIYSYRPNIKTKIQSYQNSKIMSLHSLSPSPHTAGYSHTNQPDKETRSKRKQWNKINIQHYLYMSLSRLHTEHRSNEARASGCQVGNLSKTSCFRWQGNVQTPWILLHVSLPQDIITTAL